MRMSAIVRAPQRAPLLHVAKSAVATAPAWVVADLITPGPPVFAAIAALLVVQPSVNQSFAKAIERSIGVIAGVVVASVFGIWLGDATWVVILTVTVALLIGWALRMTAGTANQVAISALLVLALSSATPQYAFDRILETLIGAAIGVVVNVALVPPVAVTPAHRAVEALGEGLASALERLADALEHPRTPSELAQLLLDARAVRPALEEADRALAAGADSLMLNPRSRRHRAELVALEAAVERFRPIVTQMSGMTRGYSERYEVDIVDDPAVRAIAEQLHRASHDVRLRVRTTEAPASPGVTRADLLDDEGDVLPIDEPPALTAQLQIARPPSVHWILVGSLLEDLRRIHETLTEADAAD